VNPIVALIVWNVATYLLLGVRAWRWPTAGAARSAASSTPGHVRAAPAGNGYEPGIVQRLVFGRGLGWLLRLRARVNEGTAAATDYATVGRCFAALWWPAVRPALVPWLSRLLHLGALGLAAGAVLGMYVRGLFFAYHVVWSSTFINDPGVAAFLVRCLLGPAALVLGWPPPDRADVMRLLTPEGDPAAPWIHLYAVTALLVIGIPRTLLAIHTSRQLARVRHEARIDLDEAYYRAVLERARAVSPEKLRDALRHAVEEECQSFAARLAGFVCETLYDREITPALWRFRDEGGTLADLETRLRAQCEAFAPALARELPSAERVLETALVMRVRRLLGDEGDLDAAAAGRLLDDVGAASARAAMHFGERLSGDLSAVIAAVVSGAVALAVGTVTGGFGESLGIALLAGLVESGPIGWLIGAIGALVAAGAGFWLGRAKLREGVKSVPLPSAALKVALWRRRFERVVADGRQTCDASVRASLAGRMQPLAATIADRLWDRLRPVVGELQRPRPAQVRSGEPEDTH
jgi:hypothetical protein